MEKKYVDEDLLAQLAAQLRSEMLTLEHIYPVGSLYISTTNTNPSTLFRLGTWEAVEDRFLLAAGGSYKAGNTGGEASHTLTISEMPSHTHKPTTNTPGTSEYNEYAFTINRHYSSSSVQRMSVDKGSGYTVMAANKNADDYGGNSDIEQSLQTAPAGDGVAHNNMPPYLVVYMWRRTQ